MLSKNILTAAATNGEKKGKGRKKRSRYELHILFSSVFQNKSDLKNIKLLSFSFKSKIASLFNSKVGKTLFLILMLIYFL